MASKDELLQQVRKQRAGREEQRQREEEATVRRQAEEKAALQIQRVAKGGLVRQEWSNGEWKSLQKQVDDLDKLAEMVRQKGQHFVPPVKVLLPLMCRTSWQRQRPAADLAQLCGRLATFVVSALRAPLSDAQRSLCAAFGSAAEGCTSAVSAAAALAAAAKPEPSRTVLHFEEILLAAVCNAKGAAGVLELVEFLDVQAWGQGRALKEVASCRQLSVQMLESACRFSTQGSGGVQSSSPGNRVGGVGPRPAGAGEGQSGLTMWRAAATAAISAWPGDGASVPERLQGLVGIAAAWLRLAEARADAGMLLEAVASVPRIGTLLAQTPPSAGSTTPLPWAGLLRSLAHSLKHSRHEIAGEARDHRSAQSLDREYMLVYLSGNLWELHSKVGLPLESVLTVQSLLTEHIEVSMLPGAPSHTVDESAAVRALRGQLQHLVDAPLVIRLFSRVLHLHPRQSGAAELSAQTLRPYQRHCIAVALHEVSPKAVESLCTIYSALLLKARMSMRTAEAGWGPQVFYGLANTLAYMEGGDLVKVLWRFVMGFYHSHGQRRGEGFSDSGFIANTGSYHMLHLHATMLSQLLGVMSQDELRKDGGALSEQDLCEYIAQTTSLIARLVWQPQGGSASLGGVAPVAGADASAPRGPLMEALLAQCSKVLTQLQTFASRGSLSQTVPAPTWLASSEVLRDFRQVVDQEVRAAEGEWQSQSQPGPLAARAEKLLRYAPQSVPFEQRVNLLRARIQGVREQSLGRPAIRVVIRRTHLFEDGLMELSNVNWHARFQVVFVNEHGRAEQGQDAGGLFKEFWEKLAETAFNPDYGLFKATEARQLYPNPQANKYHERVERLFEFLGLVIGKAIFEGIVVEPCFAPFFLAKLLGRHNSYYDLQSLDPALFNNLQQLKGYEGNVSDLCCSFVANADNGEEVPLLAGGHDTPVTNENRYRYIYLLSDYKLNVEQKAASAAFLAGFQKLVDERWLRMFGEDELQQVISGAQGGSIDVEDLQRHTQYSNCSGPRDRFVVDFWNALKAMDLEHRAGLLRFVTSCSRTPLLGFGHLVPPFTVHKVQVHSDKEKLPTASTCFNTLKLPAYSNWKVMKQKLEFVIESGAGFDLD